LKKKKKEALISLLSKEKVMVMGQRTCFLEGKIGVLMVDGKDQGGKEAQKRPA